jgi:beta-glucanase (GH16 family)
MFILVNLALGGGWAGEPNAETPFPSDFEVDYVRVWEKSK